MRVLNVSDGADTGGDGIRTKRAFDADGEWHYRSACRTSNFIGYPQDLPWDRALEEWRLADVVHVRQTFAAEALLGAPKRPLVIHHHGTIFRRNQRRLLREQRARKAVGLAATLDLWLAAPDDLEWLPAPYDLAWLESLRRPSPGALRIAHAPTNRGIKSTAQFLRACERLGRELPVEVILIERLPWAACLAEKARADVYYDQVTLGYGNNAIEAWGMGIPVIAGAAAPTLREMERRFGHLPFYLADEGTIYQALRALAEPWARKDWAERGMEFARRWHDQASVVARLKAAYLRAGGTIAP